MKAMQFSRFGGLGGLHEAQRCRPIAPPAGVVVDVTAVSINPVDWKLRSGALRYLSIFQRSTIPCFDFAGRVSEVGSAVTSPGLGQRVFGLTAGGSASEAIVVPAESLVPIPQGISDEEAAGVPLAGMTALQALNTPPRRTAHEAVLIVGASGGVGHYAVQIAKAMGSTVTAVCSTRNLDWVGQLGADRVLDYFRGDLDRPSPEYDRVLDAVSLGSFDRWRRWLKPEGAYVTLLPRGDILLHRLTLPCCSRQKSRSILLKPSPDDLKQLAAWMASGQLRTVIDRVYPMDQLALALEHSRRGHARGKIIVRIAGSQ